MNWEVEADPEVGLQGTKLLFDILRIPPTHHILMYVHFWVFCNNLYPYIFQSSESVSLDLLTYADLESLRQRKTGSVPKSNVPHGKTVSLNSKRYLIVTYTVEFDRIHYPLPLPYMGKPDPRALQEVIRQQRSEIKAFRQQVGYNTVGIKVSAFQVIHPCIKLSHFQLCSSFANREQNNGKVLKLSSPLLQEC